MTFQVGDYVAWVLNPIHVGVVCDVRGREGYLDALKVRWVTTRQFTGIHDFSTIKVITKEEYDRTVLTYELQQ